MTIDPKAQPGSVQRVVGMNLPVSEIEAAITDAVAMVKRTNKTQYVRAMNWEDLYASIGFTDDPDLEIGKLHATVGSGGEVLRHWIHPND